MDRVHVSLMVLVGPVAVAEELVFALAEQIALLLQDLSIENLSPLLNLKSRFRLHPIHLKL